MTHNTLFFFFSSRRRHTILTCDWSSDVCSSDLEAHHGVQIADGALVAAAALSDRYITSRFLPDKAIDLVDEAASRLRSEERRVGKECRSRWWPDHEKKKVRMRGDGRGAKGEGGV